LPKSLLSQLTGQGEVAQTHLSFAQRGFGCPTHFLFGCHFQIPEVLGGVAQFELCLRVLAVDFVKRRLEILATRIDGTKKARESEPADIGIVRPLALPRDGLLEVGQLAVDIRLHGSERCGSPLQLLGAKPSEAKQVFPPFHSASPFLSFKKCLI